MAAGKRLLGVRTWIAVLVMGAASLGVRGQPCTPAWQPGDGLLGPAGDVNSLVTWDPDGAGPTPPRLVVGGAFRFVGSTLAGNVAMWDGAAWHAMGAGLGATGDEVTSLAVMQNGDLVAAGRISIAGGQPVHNVVRWNGTEWESLGGGLAGGNTNYVPVQALVVLPNGDLVAGGYFTTAGGAPVGYVARWNGAAWLPMGTGFTGSGGNVTALAVRSNGQLVAGGLNSDLASSGGVFAWDETSAQWTNMWPGFNTLVGVVEALLPMPDGSLVAAGRFPWQGVWSAARWDGTTWTALGTALSIAGGGAADVRHLCRLANGDVLASGFFTLAGGVSVNGLARWDGNSWFSFGAGVATGSAAMLLQPDGKLVFGAWSTWDGQSWSYFLNGGGPWGTVRAVGLLPGGDLIAGGDFTSAGSVQLSRIGRRDRTGWHAMGPGFNGDVNAIAVYPNGTVVAGGTFTAAGATPVNRIAQWDGTQWLPLGAGAEGLNAAVNALKLLPNGDLIVGGYFAINGGPLVGRVARWAGGVWSPVGTGLDSSVGALALMPNGDFVAGGYAFFGSNLQTVVRWDGAVWSPLGQPRVKNVQALAVAPNGELFVGGWGDAMPPITVAYLASRWNGSSWTPLQPPQLYDSNSVVRAMSVLPNGSVILGGEFRASAGGPLSHIIGWNGATWFPLGSGIGEGWVQSFAVTAQGDLFVGGNFEIAGENISVGIARWGCPECYANCDHSSAPPTLNANDFQCFLNLFAAGVAEANCDRSTAPPVLNVNDFQCFINAFAVGCP